MNDTLTRSLQRIAEEMAAVLDSGHELKFEYDASALSWPGEHGPLAQRELSSSPFEATASHEPLDDDDGSEADQQSDNGEESDDSLPAYDLQEDDEDGNNGSAQAEEPDDGQTARKSVAAPVYLRECLRMMRATEERDEVQMALHATERIVRSNPDDLCDVALEMALQLLHLRDDLCVDQFDVCRYRTMVALVAMQPLAVGTYVLPLDSLRSTTHSTTHSAAIVVGWLRSSMPTSTACSNDSTFSACSLEQPRSYRANNKTTNLHRLLTHLGAANRVCQPPSFCKPTVVTADHSQSLEDGALECQLIARSPIGSTLSQARCSFRSWSGTTEQGTSDAHGACLYAD